MVDRQIIYVGQIPQDTDLLLTNKNVMVAFGYLMQALLGTATVVDGLACAPTGPATLTVNVGGGSIYALEQIDATAYGSVNADTTDQIVKQGIIIGTQNFPCPAPVTSGQSVVYLIEAAYQDVDTGSTVLPYYDASNPSVAYSGPNNTGISQNTIRQGLCKVQVKTGVAATTGTQVTPSPDAGFIGLYAITVANAQATITSGNIVQLPTAPFIGPKLPGVLAAIQSGSSTYAADTSGSANTITVAFTPAITALNGPFTVRVKVANTNTGATVMNTNGLGNVSVVTTNGSSLSANALIANGIYELVYDANGTRWQVQNPTPATATANGYFYGGTSGGSANIQTLATLTPSGFTLIQGNAIAFTAGFTNTGATTMAANSTTATAIKIDTGSGLAALTGGEIVSGNDYVIYYDGTQYVLIDPSTLAFLNSPALTGTPTAPTPSPGDNSTKIATTAFSALKQQPYVSSQQSVTAGGSLTLAHGFGTKPLIVLTTIVCQSSENGFTTGDELIVSMGAPFGATSTTAEGASITIDSTNIYVKFSSDAPLNNIVNKSTGGTASLTLANWKLVVKAFA